MNRLTLTKSSSHDSLFSDCSSSPEYIDEEHTSSKPIDGLIDPPNSPVVDPTSASQITPNETHQILKPDRYVDPTSSTIVKISEVPGLYYLPGLIQEELEDQLIRQISDSNLFCGGTQNQIMFFSTPQLVLSSSEIEVTLTRPEGGSSHSFLNWPTFLIELIHKLPNLFHAGNPENLDDLNDKIFDAKKLDLPWQVILNLYRPGEGISSHIDLLDRFDTIIIGLSLGSGVIMDFEHESQAKLERVYLDRGSGYVLTRDARFDWKHGIASNQSYDVILDHHSPSGNRRVLRNRNRISITIRRLREGGEVLGI